MKIYDYNPMTINISRNSFSFIYTYLKRDCIFSRCLIIYCCWMFLLSNNRLETFTQSQLLLSKIFTERKETNWVNMFVLAAFQVLSHPMTKKFFIYLEILCIYIYLSIYLYMGKITQNRTFFAVFEDRVRVVKVRYNIST